jgi:hypothetical protein
MIIGDGSVSPRLDGERLTDVRPQAQRIFSRAFVFNDINQMFVELVQVLIILVEILLGCLKELVENRLGPIDLLCHPAFFHPVRNPHLRTRQRPALACS